MEANEVGRQISVNAKWDVYAIAEIAAYALEDANWHSLAGCLFDIVEMDVDDSQKAVAEFRAAIDKIKTS